MVYTGSLVRLRLAAAGGGTRLTVGRMFNINISHITYTCLPVFVESARGARRCTQACPRVAAKRWSVTQAHERPWEHRVV